MTDEALATARSIDSYLKIPEETDFLVREAEKATWGIIEVGSWTGRSSIYLESVAREKKIPFVAIDTWQSCDLEPGKDYYPIWKENMVKAGLLPADFALRPDDRMPATANHLRGSEVDARNWDRIFVLRMASTDASRLLPILDRTSAVTNPPRADFLFIDADHEYESVKQDFFAWVPHLAPGSTVVFHDVHCGHEGVRKFFLELGQGGLEFWEDGNIGAVRLKPLTGVKQ